MKKIKIIVLLATILCVGGTIITHNFQGNLNDLTIETKIQNAIQDSEKTSLTEKTFQNQQVDNNKTVDENFNDESKTSFSKDKEEINKNVVSTEKSNKTQPNVKDSNFKVVEKKDSQVVQEPNSINAISQGNQEEVKIQEKKEVTTKDTVEAKPISFYESITNGEKEFYTEKEALDRGLEIAQNELKFVMDYNEQHPNSQISPDINYYRVYPSFIDENNHTWYYLHFFCQSGEGNDKKLKKMY